MHTCTGILIEKLNDFSRSQPPALPKLTTTTTTTTEAIVVELLVGFSETGHAYGTGTNASRSGRAVLRNPLTSGFRDRCLPSSLFALPPPAAMSTQFLPVRAARQERCDPECKLKAHKHARLAEER